MKKLSTLLGTIFPDLFCTINVCIILFALGSTACLRMPNYGGDVNKVSVKKRRL